MKENQTQFLKMLELYRNIRNIRKYFMNKSMLKALEFKAICLSAFYLLYLVYLIVNPIRHLVDIIQLQNTTTGGMLVYFYILIYRCYLSLFFFAKMLKDSDDNQLFENFAELETDEEDRKYYNTNSVYSHTTFFVFIFTPLFLDVCVDIIFPLCSNDFLTFLIFPLPTYNKYHILVLIIQTIFNGISLVIVLLDLYIDFIISIAAIYEFNKVAKEAQRCVTEQQSDNTGVFKKHKKITEICNTHDTLSSVLRLVNESLQMTSGFIVLYSIISCCLATYGMINYSFTTNLYTYVYVLFNVNVMLLILLGMIWLGIRLNRSVHSITQSIHYMQFQGVDQEVVAKILVFLNRLTTESHGIDVGGCFVITPSSTLTMIGSFITYILVVIQTKPL
ncbi:uncharacterized protein LOC118764608 isoform X1 [Octopus sinensis]|uniref:Uncharacterized protein LOC118764608 isoform X1 n=1 Tax=Octopus sinensis TaxID=2607531 RepID=A0A7E6F0Q9_9MOLL|nr:uncharacterized protein LOC118764608 isoform X1 [Octopus sinensis]